MYRSLQSPHGRGLGVATEGEADQEDRRSFDQAEKEKDDDFKQIGRRPQQKNGRRP